MPVAVKWWDDEHTIVFYRFLGTWTWDEFYRAYHEALAMERSVSSRVDIILDLLPSGAIPHNALMHVKPIADEMPDNIGLCVVVSPSPLIVSLYELGVKFYSPIGQYFRIVPTIEDAERVIAETRHVEKPS